MRTLAFLAGVTVVFAASCAAVMPETDVTVVLPVVPAHWALAFPDLGYQLVYCNAIGVALTMDAPGKGSVVIAGGLRGGSAILAYPRARADSSHLLRPAGALFYSGREKGSPLQLTWEDGPLALVISLLASLGRDSSLFNHERLAHYFAQVPDPWELDLGAIAQKIADGRFTAYDIDRLPSRDVELVTGSGEWFFESPFAEVLDQGGAVTARSLSLGMHGLYCAEGGARVLYVGEQETVMAP